MMNTILRIRIIFQIIYFNIFLLLTRRISLRRFRFAIRKQLLISSFFKDEKYVKAGGKYFINPFAPYFPSRFFNKMLEHNTVDTYPMKPNYAQISITNVCPCKCFHCHVENSQRKDDNIPEAIIKKTIDDMIDAGFLVLFFVGGEPISRFDVLESCLKYSGGRIDTRIFTSGVGMTREKLHRLKEAGLKGICVSLDHYEAERHNKLRNHSAAFKSACFTIREASQMGFYVSAVCCVTGAMARSGEYKKVVDLAESYGAHSIQLNEIRPVGRALKNEADEIFLNDSDKDLLIEYHRQHNKSDRKIATVMPWYNERPDKFGCQATSGQVVYVESTGIVQPCVLLRAGLGNIKDERFRDVWQRFTAKCSHPVNRCIVNDLNQAVAPGKLPLASEETYKIWDRLTEIEAADLFKKIRISNEKP